jgi:GT2 family glycosyltransferase/glycosyltransferase involved in cell wall biosynthesis
MAGFRCRTLGGLISLRRGAVPDEALLPVVSVVVVNYRGAEDTITCLRALRDDLDYPADRLQVICVDNASGDGGAERIKAAVTGVEVIESEQNLGFAGGCNLGVQRARGTVVAFLNNDARPHRDWVRAAVEVLLADRTIGAVASKVLDWDGKLIDFVDGGLTWYGMGYKPHAGEVDDGSHDKARDVLFGTGSALFVRADTFRELGGFDERFFMFYEDVDLGWRLNLRGWRVRYEPRSLSFHRHHRSMSTLDSSRETYLLERNALAALYKNVSDATLAKVLPAALALAVRRGTARGDVDPAQLEITNRPAAGEDDSAPIPIPRVTVAAMLAIDRFVEMLPSLRESRAIEQAARVRTDGDLLPLMRNPLERASPEAAYLLAHENLVENLRIEELYGRRRNILILTSDTVTERMAGPAIRAWNMADILAGEHDVRLVTLNAHFNPPQAPFVVKYRPPHEMDDDVDWADIVILQGHALEQVPKLKFSKKIVICDVYDPMHLEQLEQGKDLADTRRAHVVEVVTEVLSNQLLRGDFFLCASERQRHFWLGHLGAIGRLTPTLYDSDPSMRSLLAVAPFGLSAKPPQRTGAGPRGTIAGIGPDDKIVIWAGGVYNWFDPLTLLHAVDRLRRTRPDAKLLFLGMKHPNPDVGEMDMSARTRALADRLDIVGKNVFFNETWVPYDARQNWLLDADCGVTSHYEHVETTFAFRTRVLDYLWAGLPIVTTDGDSFADLVDRERLGVVVPAEDPDALAAALERVLYDEEFAQACRERIAVVRDRYTWENALTPLVEFCRNPRVAADRLAGAGPLVGRPRLGRGEVLRRDLALVKEYLNAGGPGELARRAAGRLRRVLGQGR